MAQAGALGTGEDQMVEHGTVERFGRNSETPGAAAVGIARTRIAAGVVVREDDAGAAMLGRVGDDGAQRKCRAGLIAQVPRQVKAARVFIDMRDPQAFPRWIRVAEASGEKLTRGGEAIELQR